MTKKISKAQQRLNDYFRTLREIEFHLYETPALPGGDLGCFPAAHPRPLTREQQRAAFQKTLEGRAVSSYTPQEYAEAKRLHVTLQSWQVGTRGWDRPLRLQLPGMVR